MSPRIVLFPILAACASTPRPIANSTPEPTRYALQPVSLLGGEGPHSASHSSTRVTGMLELGAKQATLHLAMTTSTSWVHCPPEMEGSMQACAPEGAKSRKSIKNIELVGAARWEHGQLTASLRDGDLRAELRCEDSVLGLGCAFAPGTDLFGGPTMRAHPDRFVFASRPEQRFELDATRLSSGEQIGATLVLAADGKARVEVTVDGAAVEALDGSYRWTAAGFVVQAQTSPTRTWSMSCKEATGARPALACEVSADRSVFGKPDHLTGHVVFARRS